jgi:hypothetical protein
MRIMRRKSISTLFAMLGLVVCVTPAYTPAPAGTVVALTGSCSVYARVLERGDGIEVNDTVDVPADSNLKLQMADGTLISVAPESRLTVASYSVGETGRHTMLVLTQGLLRALVPPTAGPLTFDVSTPVGLASLRSAAADWFVRAEAGSAQVGVLTGAVDFASAATGESVSIPAHWGTRLEAGRSPMMPRMWAQMEFEAVIRLTACCQPKQETAPSGR